METIKIALHASNCTALGIIGKMRVATELRFWHLHVPVKCLLLFIFCTQLYVIYKSQLVKKTSLICLRLNILLVARCSFFFFARCSLLSAHCSLLFASCSLLFARQEILNVFMGNCPTISHMCYLFSRLSLFTSLVLLKKMRARDESKISSC